jgi:hypothetical protein
MRLPRQLAAILAAAACAACVVHEQPVPRSYGYGYGPTYQVSAQVGVGAPSPFYVSSMPPEPLYEQMSPSPGYGFVWIDGSWHWNGYEWVWISGRWEHEQPGYLYVQPGYAYVDSRYVYTPGYWSRPDHVPSGWGRRDGRDGRPSVVVPPPNARPVRAPTPPPRADSHAYLTCRLRALGHTLRAFALLS